MYDAHAHGKAVTMQICRNKSTRRSDATDLFVCAVTRSCLAKPISRQTVCVYVTYAKAQQASRRISTRSECAQLSGAKHKYKCLVCARSRRMRVPACGHTGAAAALLEVGLVEEVRAARHQHTNRAQEGCSGSTRQQMTLASARKRLIILVCDAVRMQACVVKVCESV